MKGFGDVGWQRKKEKQDGFFKEVLGEIGGSGLEHHNVYTKSNNSLDFNHLVKSLFPILTYNHFSKMDSKCMSLKIHFPAHFL